MILLHLWLSPILIIIIISPALADGNESTTVNLRFRADLAIVIDTSWSIKQIAFQKITKALIPLISNVNISQEYTHVAVMHDGKEVLALRNGTNLEIVSATLEGLKRKMPGFKANFEAIKAMFDHEDSDTGREAIRIILYVHDYMYHLRYRSTLVELIDVLKQMKLHIFQMIICPDSMCDAYLHDRVLKAGTLHNVDNVGVQKLFVRSAKLGEDMRGLVGKMHSFSASCQQTITVGECYWMKDEFKKENYKKCKRKLKVWGEARDSSCESAMSPFYEAAGSYSELLECAKTSLDRYSDLNSDPQSEKIKFKETIVFNLCERRNVPEFDYREFSANISFSPEHDLNACLESIESEIFYGGKKYEISLSNLTDSEKMSKKIKLDCHILLLSNISQTDNFSDSEYVSLESMKAYCNDPHFLKICQSIFLNNNLSISEICPDYAETAHNNQTCIEFNVKYVPDQEPETSSVLPSVSPTNHNSTQDGPSAGMAGDDSGMSGTHKTILIVVICGLAVLVIVGLVMFKLERNRRRRGKAEINRTVKMEDLKTDS